MSILTYLMFPIHTMGILLNNMKVGHFMKYTMTALTNKGASAYALQLNPAINNLTEFKFDGAFGQWWIVTKNPDNTISINHSGVLMMAI